MTKNDMLIVHGPRKQRHIATRIHNRLTDGYRQTLRVELKLGVGQSGKESGMPKSKYSNELKQKVVAEFAATGDAESIAKN
jgi:hypothetical protein